MNIKKKIWSCLKSDNARLTETLMLLNKTQNHPMSLMKGRNQTSDLAELQCAHSQRGTVKSFILLWLIITTARLFSSDNKKPSNIPTPEIWFIQPARGELRTRSAERESLLRSSGFSTQVGLHRACIIHRASQFIFNLSNDVTRLVFRCAESTVISKQQTSTLLNRAPSSSEGQTGRAIGEARPKMMRQLRISRVAIHSAQIWPPSEGPEHAKTSFWNMRL